MTSTLLHVHSDTPAGREILLQAAYFCKRTGSQLRVLCPTSRQYLMYFADAVATLAFGGPYLRSSNSSPDDVGSIARDFGIDWEIVEPKGLTAANLPEIPADFAVMTTPRAATAISSRSRLHLRSSTVRCIVRNAPFQVLLAAPVYKPWQSILCCYGGGPNAARAVRTAYQLSRQSGVPLTIFTHVGGRSRDAYTRDLERTGLLTEVASGRACWALCEGGDLQDHLNAVPHDALVVAGASAPATLRAMLFGGTLSKLLSLLPQSFLVVGPRCATDSLVSTLHPQAQALI